MLGGHYCISTVIYAINGSSSNQNRNMVCKRTGIYAWYVRMALESIVGPDYILYYYCTTITTLLSLVFLWPMPPIVGVVSAAQSCCLVVLLSCSVAKLFGGIYTSYSCALFV